MIRRTNSLQLKLIAQPISWFNVPINLLGSRCKVLTRSRQACPREHLELASDQCTSVSCARLVAERKAGRLIVRFELQTLCTVCSSLWLLIFDILYHGIAFGIQLLSSWEFVGTNSVQSITVLAGAGIYSIHFGGWGQSILRWTLNLQTEQAVKFLFSFW